MPPIPAAPTGLTATAGNGQITLRWNASATPNVMYWIEYRTSGAWQRSPYPLNSCCSFTLSLLTNGTWYEVRLRATNLSGDSAPSNVASARPMPPRPAAPTGLTASSTGNPEIRLQWNASPTPNVYYWIEYRFAGTSAWSRLSLPLGSCCTFTVSYLEPRRAYEFRILATNLAGDGPPSNVAGATTTITPPPAPTSFSALPHAQGGSVVAAWNPPGNTALRPTGYTVQARWCGTSQWFTIGFMITGLTFQYRGGGCNDYRVIGDRYGTMGPASDVKRAYTPRNDYPYPNWNVHLFDPWGFAVRECTSFAAWRIRQNAVPNFDNWWRQPALWPYWGNATSWDISAHEASVRTTPIPAVGSVLQKDGSIGHVAWVVAINAGAVYVEEYNGQVPDGYSIHVYTNLNGLEFIHFEDFAGW
jgi:surface antigen